VGAPDETAHAQPPSAAQDQDLPRPPSPTRPVAPGEVPLLPFEIAWRGLMAASTLLALVVVFFACLAPIAVTDFWWQAKTGELIVRTGSVPSRDPFSWTSAGQPWLVHEWLTEVFFYFAFTYLPNGVLVFYKSGLAVLACALVMARAWLRCGSLPLAIAAAVAAGLVLRNYADLRPQMVTFVLLAGLLLALDEYRAGRMRRLPFVIPPLFILWANLHGGVVVGLILISIWIVGETAGQWFFARRWEGLARLAAAVGLSFLAVALNPNGFHVYAYPFQVLGHPEVMDYITEWWSPNFHHESMRAFEGMLLCTFAALALAAPRANEARFGEVLVLGAMAHAALLSQRNTAPFALCAAPVLASALATLWDCASLGTVRAAAAHPVFRTAGAMLLTAGLVGLLFTHLPRTHEQSGGRTVSRVVAPSKWFEHGINLDSFPRTAVAQMEHGMWPGRIYNDYIWGGYLIWKLHPERKVFIDGRAEVYYPTKTFDDEMTIHRVSAGWREALDRRGVEVVLTAVSGSLAAALARDPDWQLSFRGPVEVVYTRKAPLGASP